jgi:hypothetical protein
MRSMKHWVSVIALITVGNAPILAAEVVTEPAAEPACIPCGWDDSAAPKATRAVVVQLITEPAAEPACIPCGWEPQGSRTPSDTSSRIRGAHATHSVSHL